MDLEEVEALIALLVDGGLAACQIRRRDHLCIFSPVAPFPAITA